MAAKLSFKMSSYTHVDKSVAGMLTKSAIGEYLLKASPPKNIAATMRVPRSRARFVEIVAFAKPQIMLAYARPMINGADVGETKGFPGSRTDQITMPYSIRICLIRDIGALTMKLSTKNSMKKRYPIFVWVTAGNAHKTEPGPPNEFGLIPAAVKVSASFII